MSVGRRRHLKATLLEGTYATDSFNRANSGSIGQAETGQVWEVYGGGWHIESMHAISIVNSDSWAVVDVGNADIAVEASLSGTGLGIWSGVTAGFIDNDNYYSLQTNSDSGEVMLVKKANGVSEYLRFAPGWIDGSVLKLEVLHFQDYVVLKGYINDGLAFRTFDATPIAPASTKCGLVSGIWDSNAPFVDNFSAYHATDGNDLNDAKLKAGYLNRIFEDDFDSPTTIDYTNSGSADYKWYVERPWYTPSLAPSEAQVANSILTINQVDSRYNWGISTYHYSSRNGRGFKYGYYEARMRFDPSLGSGMSHDIQWPAFWSESINRAINEPARWAELDFFEAYHPMNAPYAGKFYGTLHDWTKSSPNDIDRGTIGNSIVDMPPGVNFSDWHDYGCLWEPGRIRWYFDDQLMLTQLYFSDAAPVPNYANHPVGTYAVLDGEPLGMTVILGSGDGWPLEVDWVRIWGA